MEYSHEGERRNHRDLPKTSEEKHCKGGLKRGKLTPACRAKRDTLSRKTKGGKKMSQPFKLRHGGESYTQKKKKKKVLGQGKIYSKHPKKKTSSDQGVDLYTFSRKKGTTGKNMAHNMIFAPSEIIIEPGVVKNGKGDREFPYGV